MSEEQKTRRRHTGGHNGGLRAENLMKLEPGDNARYIRAARAAVDLPKIDISDPKQVEERINQYFDYCAEHDIKPGFVMMANWIGVHRDTLNEWKRGVYRASTHSDVIQKAVSQLESLWEMYMIDGKINIVAGIFIGKQYYGAVDKQELVIAPAENSTAPLSAEEIAARLPDPDADYSVE